MPRAAPVRHGWFGAACIGARRERRVTELWETRSAPADNSGNAEVTDHPFRLAPPKNGTVLRIIEYPPDKQRLAALEQQRASADDGSGHGDAFDRGSPRHPGFHKTSSTDYAIVLSGQIVALMDEGEVLLKAGDVLIQRGTNHAWSNRREPAYRFVLIDAGACIMALFCTLRKPKRNRLSMQTFAAWSPRSTK